MIYDTFSNKIAFDAFMRKLAPCLLLLIGILSAHEAPAQSVQYSSHFDDATLRIKYLRSGNRTHNAVRVIQDDRLEQWSGSLTALEDPFANGHFRISLRDTLTGGILYSRCYNSLFSEYRDTPAGRDCSRTFEEVVRTPWPKHPVNICWEQLGEDQRYHIQHTHYFDPSQHSGNPDAPTAARHTTTPLKLHFQGDIHKKVDVVIVPEGYGPADSTKLRIDLKRFCRFLLRQEPFASRRNDFNVWGIPLTGEASGITDPNNGIKVNSLVGASYNTFGADRYLMTMHLFQLHDAIGDTPCDHIVIMANSDTYGGGGIYNFYAMCSLSNMAALVLPHELGHSMGGLADEYVDEDLSYGGTHCQDAEPTEPNITSLKDFDKKWKALLPNDTPIPTPENSTVPQTENGPIGVYEGAGYRPKGLYRPTQHCMMRNFAPFCPICCQRMHEVFDLYTH